METLNKRNQLFSEQTTIYRLINGKIDGFPNICLDRYGDYYLLSSHSRPSENFIKSLSHHTKGIYFKNLTQNATSQPLYLKGKKIETPFIAQENLANFQIDFRASYSPGFFPDQRENRQRVFGACKNDTKILNTFAYTGSFSIFAAKAGATTTTLDLSPNYLDWAKTNFELNQLTTEEHYFCRGDVFHWLRRFIRQQKKFDGIILDPPTFSKVAKAKIFRVEKDYRELVELAKQCLNKEGWLLCCTNCQRLSLTHFKQTIADAFDKPIDLTSFDMPVDFKNSSYLKTLWVHT